MRSLRARVMSRIGLPDIGLGGGARRRLTIVMYHAVVRAPLELPHWCFLDEGAFRRQLRHLQRHFDVVPLLEAVERLRSGVLRSPTAVITFDDGFQNNYDVAFPALRDAGLPATIFLTTGLIGTADTVWFCRLHHALSGSKASVLEWQGRRFDLSGTDARARTHVLLRRQLKRLPHPQLLAEVRSLVASLGDDPDKEIGTASPLRMLTRSAIADMAASGLVEFGAHTHTHAILSRLSVADQHDEIGRSVQAVRDLTGRRCELFAYPNGRAEDFEEQTIGLLQGFRMSAAVTAVAGPNDARTPLLQLRRYSIGSPTSPLRFRLLVHHWAH